MGGKTKQSQRTKNNARPSSSGRSAELLSSVKLEPGVVNIAGTQLPALFPSLAAPAVDPHVSPELQLCLKKLNKKDPITKTKALQELSELVANSKVDDVVSILPSWAHFYKILTADPDRKVRECTQACHGALAAASGRRLAPHLRALMAAWLQAQYDEHAPAQAHASHSLAKTFPDNKLPEVLSFCKESVVSQLLDVLMADGEAARTRRSESPSRAAAGALRGLAALAARLPAAHSAWLWGRLAPLCARAAFWAQADSADDRTRAAWLGLVGALTARYGAAWAAAHGARTLRQLLAAPAPSAPSPAAPCPQAWDCLLLFMHHVPDWHQYLEKKELLSKRILDILESGGWGDAKHLSNMLLPILASLSEDVLTKDFHIAFFNAIFSGLEKKTILSSKSERQYWITSLDECLRYLSTQAYEYVLEVVTSVHRTWLEKVLTDTEGQTRNHLIKYSANAMANLVKFWLRQAKEGHDEKYDQLIRNFWQNVGSTLTTQIDRLPMNFDDIEKLMDAHILLLQTLKSSFTQELKKQHSIKFEVDTQAAERELVAPAQATDPAIIERYNHNLDELVQKICSHYFEFASTKQISNPVISPLITLLVEFDSKELFLAIARQFDRDSVHALYDNVLRTWLRGDTMRCKAVVDVVFMLMRHLTEREQDAVFDTFEQFPPSVVEWCLARCVAHPALGAAAARRWARGPAAARAVAALCARLLAPAGAAARPLLMLCLTPDAAGESIVSAEAVQDVVRQVSASLDDVDCEALETRCAVAAQLASALPPDAALLGALLALTASLQRGDPRLWLDSWCEVRDAWQDGVTALAPAERARFLAAAADTLRDRLRLRSSELNISAMEHLVSLCPYLLWSGARLDVGEAVRFTRALAPDAPAQPRRVEAYATRHEMLMGNLTCPFEDNPVVQAIAADTLTELAKDDLIEHANTVLFRLMYLRTMFLNRPDDESDRNWCTELLSEDYFEGEFLNSIYDYTVICSLCDGYAFWPHYKIIEQSKNRLEMLLDDIIKETSIEIRSNIATALSARAASEGYFWAYSRRYFEAKITARDGDRTDAQSDKDSDSDKPSGPSESGKVEKESDESKEAVKTEGSTLPITNLNDMITGPALLHTLHYLQAKAKHSSDESEVVRSMYCVALAALYAAHAHEPAAAAAVRGAGARADPDVFVNTYYAHNHTMLYEKDISGASWRAVVSNASTCALLGAWAQSRGWDAPQHHWDFTNISLCSLLTSVDLSKESWGTAKVALLARAALQLCARAAAAVAALAAQCERRRPSAHVAALPAEWRDIYAPDLNHSLFSIVLFVLESSSRTSVNSNHIAVVSALIECAPHMRWDALPLSRREGRLSLERLVGAATSALGAPAHTAFKLLAYALLTALLKPLVLEDAEQLAAWSSRAAEGGVAAAAAGGAQPLRLTLMYYDAAFRRLQDIVETAVAHVRLCEEVCAMVPGTDAHALALGWLLLADVVSQQCVLARGDLTHQYIQIYREQKYTEPLLTAALRLLPAALLAAAGQPAGQHAGQPAEPFAALFTAGPDLDVYKWCGSEAVCAAACRCVWWSVRGAGAGGARGWRGAAHHRHAALLDGITRRYITPHVVKEEFALLQKKGSEIEDTEITLNRGAYEITCVLRVDDSPVELGVSLAREHPLQLPRLRAAPAAAAGSLNWLLMYLGYQNGTILNALRMWTSSVNSKLERAPQCYICYCRLHHATGRLPDVHCHTCKNKFHNVCLRKWFLSSSKMTCPLCRANF